MTQTAVLDGELEQLSLAKVGQEVSFYYRGEGEHSDQQRRAEVVEVRSDGILGKDLEYGGLKHFKNSESIDVSVVSKIEGERISFPDAQQQLVYHYGQHRALVTSLSAEQLASVYADIAAVGKTGEFVDGYIVLSESYKGPTFEIKERPNDYGGVEFVVRGRGENIVTAVIKPEMESFYVWQNENHKDGHDYNLREFCELLKNAIDS